MASIKISNLFFFITAVLMQGNAQNSTNMQINQNAPVKQNKAIFIQATPEKVWAVLTDINNWPNWNPKISKAQMNESITPSAKFKWTVNGAKIKSTLHTVDPHKTFGWSGITFGGSAIHNWYLRAQGDGTYIQVEESMEGWLIKLFKQKMNRDLEADMLIWLEQLKVTAEK